MDNFEDFLNFLIVMLFIGAFIYILILAASGTETKKKCGPHKWKPNADNRLQCVVCGFKAGQKSLEESGRDDEP